MTKYVHVQIANLKGVVHFKKKKTFADNLLTPMSSKMSMSFFLQLKRNQPYQCFREGRGERASFPQTPGWDMEEENEIRPACRIMGNYMVFQCFGGELDPATEKRSW